MLQQHIINVKNLNILSELFLGVSIIYSVLYGIISAFSKEYPLIQKSLIYVSILIFVLTLFLLVQDFHLYNLNLSYFNMTLKSDDLSFLSKFFILLFSIICLLIIKQYLVDKQINNFEYLILILLSVLGFLFITSANDLITLYIAIELQSLAFYILASFKKNSSFSIDAGLKYFILGALSSSLLLFGSSFLYGFTGSTSFDDFYYLFTFLPSEGLEISQNFDYNFVKFPLVFIFVSLFFKLALAPFHLWSPDVYEGSPTSSTIFFATVAKLGIFIVLTRIFYYGFYQIFESWRFYVVLIAVLSVLIGSFAGLEQRKLKSLLAYSSISHMGYSLIALTAGTSYGIQMLLSYLIIYLLSSLCIWSIFVFTRLKNKFPNKSNKDLTDIVLLSKSNNHFAICFIVVLFSIAGFPPMIGFLVKINVFLTAIEVSMYYVAFVSILCSVVSTFYYLRMVKIMYFENVLTGKLYYPINTDKIIVVPLFFYLLIFLFIYPALLYLITYRVGYFFII